MSPVQVFDGQGTLMAELERSTAVHSWEILGERKKTGELAVDVSTRSAKFREEYLRYGRYVLVSHAELPTWCGVITGGEWNGGAYTLSGVEAASVLAKRRPRSNKLHEGSAGGIVRALIDEANSEYPTLIEAGEIYEGGPQRQDQFNLESIFDELCEEARRAGCEWRVSGRLDSGRLRMSLDFVERLGRERTDVLLEDGHNMEADQRMVTLQGDVVNDLVVYGPQSTWDSRDAVRVQDTESMAVYGVQQAVAQMDASMPDTLRAAGEAQLKKSAWQRMTLSNITLSNRGGLFGRIGLGDVVRIKVSGQGWGADGQQGFADRVRVIALAYSAVDNRLRPVLDLWRE